MSNPTSRPASAGPALVDLHGRSPWTILPALTLGFFMIMVDTTIVNVAIPTLVKDFDVSLTTVGWVNSAYLLTFSVLLLVTGRLGDQFGPRPVFMTGLVVFTVASVGAGLSGSIEMLIAARAVQGVGSALMTPQTMSMITRVFPPRQRGAALGVWGSVAGVATILGPLLGGILIETAGWSWIFFINVPVGIVAMVFAVRWLPRLPRHGRSMDGLGVLLSTVGMFLLVFGLQEGESYHWGAVRWGVTIWEIVGTGVVLLVAFGLWQVRRGDDALLPMRLFTVRNFFLANVGGAAVSFSMIGIFFPLTLFLQEIMGLSPIRAALISLPGSIVSGIVAPFAGRLSDRISAKWVVAFGFAMFAVAVTWLGLWIDVDASPWRLLAPMAVFGLGSGSVFSPLANLATAGLDHRTAGAGAGAFNTNRQIGGVIGSAAIIAMLTARLAHTIPAAAVNASAALPVAYRQQFIDAFASAGSSFGGGTAGLTLPSGIPAEAVKVIQAAAQQAVGHGFATAVAQTMALAVVVLLAGLVSALAMRGGRTHHDVEDVEGDETPAVIASTG